MLIWLANHPWVLFAAPIVVLVLVVSWRMIVWHVKSRLPRIYKALIVATEKGIILEAKGDIKLVCGWEPTTLVGQDIAALIPRALREAHVAGMAHYRATGEGPVIGKTLSLKALGPDDTLYPVWLTVFGYEKYSEQIYGLLESRV